VDRVLDDGRVAAVVLRGNHQGGVGFGGRGTQRRDSGRELGRVVDLLVVERQIAQAFEDSDGNAVRGHLGGQLGDLTVNRGGTQAPYQRQHFGVRHDLQSLRWLVSILPRFNRTIVRFVP